MVNNLSTNSSGSPPNVKSPKLVCAFASRDSAQKRLMRSASSQIWMNITKCCFNGATTGKKKSLFFNKWVVIITGEEICFKNMSCFWRVQISMKSLWMRRKMIYCRCRSYNVTNVFIFYFKYQQNLWKLDLFVWGKNC